MSMSDNFKRGSVELLVLSLLTESDMYGYQLSQEMRERSHGLYSLLETSMYPSLYRLTDKKMITGTEKLVGKRRTRVYYHIEPEGKKYLQKLRREYLSLCRGAFYILNVESIDEMVEEKPAE